MTTNVNRSIANGSTTDPKEVVNKSQVYITTAGWKNSFAKSIKIIGELKPCEPQKEGVTEKLLIVKALIDVPLCQAA